MSKKVLVVGLVAIGGILACHLSTSGTKVCGVDVLQEMVDAIRSNGINIEKLTSLHANLEEVVVKFTDLKEREFDYVVITVKTPYMEAAVSEVKNLNGEFKVVAFQNGLDNEELLAEHFDRDRVLRFVINYAGNIVTPGTISMSFFNKPNYVGGLNPNRICENATEFARLVSDAALATECVSDIKKPAWKKTILNAVLAPLSALLGFTMAEIMTCAETRSLVELLFQEGIAVAKHLGYDYGEEFFQQGMEYLSAAGHHKPSMLIDIEKGRPTEIDFINGKIVAYGDKLDIPVPVNRAIYSLVKAKEKHERPV